MRDELDFVGLDLPIEIKDIHKIEKRILVALVFLDMKANKNIGFMCRKIPLKTLIYHYYHWFINILILMIALKLMLNEWLRCLKGVIMWN